MSVTDTARSLLDTLSGKGDKPLVRDASLSNEGQAISARKAIASGIKSAFTFEGKRTEAYKALATAIMELREVCVLPNGSPDWAGRSTVYWALLHSVTDPLFATAEGIAYKQTIQRGIDNQLSESFGKVRSAHIRSYCERSLTPEQIAPGEDGSINQAIKDAMRAQYEAQGTKGDPPVANLVLPSEYGGPVKPGKVPKVQPNSPEAIGEKLDTGLRAITEQKDGEPTISPAFMLDGVHRAVSVAVKWQTEHVGYKSGAKALRDKYEAIQALASVALAALEGQYEDEEQTLFAASVWKAPKGK